MNFTRLAPAILFLALAACMNAEPSAPAAIPVGSRDTGPGPDDADGLMSAMMFGRVCVDTAPSMARARQEIASLPFVQHPETGTYYHTNVNLSFKLGTGGDRSCSMVFGTREEAGGLAILFAATTGASSIELDPDRGSAAANLPNGGRFSFRPGTRHGGLTFYNAYISYRP